MSILGESMELDKIHFERCEDTMHRLASEGKFIDLVLTSPPYNTNKKFGKLKTVLDIKDKEAFPYLRYDTVLDVMTNDEYMDWTVGVFNAFSKIVKPNGVVLYNMSYGNENTETMLNTVCKVIASTEWSLADIIVWKKSNALPNNVSPNRLTRIVEYVFVFCRGGNKRHFIVIRP
jgi:DNA modification methylase